MSFAWQIPKHRWHTNSLKFDLPQEETLDETHQKGRDSVMTADQLGDEDPLSELVQRCQDGQRNAQQDLYEFCHQAVYVLMIRMVGSQDAADLMQQVFLQAFRKIAQFQGQSKFQTWLYRISVNEALQHLRRSRRKHQVLSHDPIDERPQAAGQREAKDLLQQALARLEPLLRSVFLLKESHGLSYREIAETTDIPEGTVGSRLTRARRQLRKHLIDLGWEE